jgi:RND family efflux transporter MFP subunit
MKIVAVIGVLVVAGIAWSGRSLVLGSEKRAVFPASSRARVTRGDLVITVEENGYLTAKENVNVKPKFKGQGTITWLIEEGKLVKPGDLLVEFDRTELETQITALENNLAQYEIELEAARANLEIQQRDNQATIEKAELALEASRLTLEKFEQGDTPNELRKLDLAVEKAESEFSRAKERYQQVPELVAQGFLTRIQEEEERIRLREAEIGQESARRERELYQTYTQRMERTKHETAGKDAVRELENSRKKAEINLKEKQAAVTQREGQVTSTRTRLEQQRTELEHYTVKCEKEGTVHYGDPEQPWWRDDIKVGSTVYQGATLVTIPDLSSMQVLIQVHEADIDKVALELPVIVTVDSRPGESFEGKITEIATVANSANWTDESNKSFKVEVTLAGITGTLRPGVTAKAEIRIETLGGVLQVPLHAIVPENGKNLAFVLQGDGYEQREVEIGKHDSHRVEIRSGLSEGDEVLLYDPRSGGAGAGQGVETKGAESAPSLPVTAAAG